MHNQPTVKTRNRLSLNQRNLVEVFIGDTLPQDYVRAVQREVFLDSDTVETVSDLLEDKAKRWPATSRFPMEIVDTVSVLRSMRDTLRKQEGLCSTFQLSRVASYGTLHGSYKRR